MAIKPILFNGDMVRATLDGRKTVMRQKIKIPKELLGNDEWVFTDSTPEGYISCRGRYIYGYGQMHYKLPYKPGDIMYVRESFRLIDFNYIDGDCIARVQYRADEALGDYLHHLKHGMDEKIGWRPSIHMPREAARIWLRVTDVSVERLHDIAGQDVLKEGLNSHVHPKADYFDGNQREMFAKVWDSTIKKSDIHLYGWRANPWVLAIKFERCEKPKGEV